MASAVEISNIALVGLGANTISSLTDNSSQALTVNTVWDQCRRALLRLHPWNFATKRVELPQDVTAPVFGYQYAYQLPADNLRLLEVHRNNQYKVEGNRILTNSISCQIKYIFDATDTSLWDAAFSELMAAKLRYEISYTITRDKESTNQSFNLYQDKLTAAQYVDASEDISDPIGEADNTLIQSRF